MLMRQKFLILALLACVMLAGCGPTLHDTKVQYTLGVSAATTTLDFLTSLKARGQLTPGQVESLNFAIEKFDLYRGQIRAAIDANIPAPVNAINGFSAALEIFADIAIEKGGML
jgi:hypothetical protein